MLSAIREVVHQVEQEVKKNGERRDGEGSQTQIGVITLDLMWKMTQRVRLVGVEETSKTDMINC